ncbi:MAG: twin-arginine translocase TatA/TatE family subunit [Thermodesulfobacteriota bacterium]|nr:twin-arginine translocase TatA/TatE family subunit [Desulfovibrio sp.]
MFGIGVSELLIVLAIVLLFYGGKKLPQIGSGLGKAIRNFRSAGSQPDEIEIKPAAPPPSPPSPPRDAEKPGRPETGA